MKKSILLLALSILCAAICSAQSLTLSGRILDASSRRPLDFASIHLMTTNISNVSNTEGIFSLKIPDDVKADSVMVSYLGYRSQKIAVSAFNGRELTISLVPSGIALEPIVVHPQDALTVVQMAFYRVEQNYLTKPAQMTAFYREMIQKRNTYVSVSEAVLDINKASYRGLRSDQVGIYKARGNYDQQRVDTLLVKFQGGPTSALEIDIAKDPFLSVEPNILNDYYTFVFEPSVTINDEIFYVIAFNQRPNVSTILFRGRLYIEPETLAIGRVEFNMNVEGKPEASSIFIRRKPTSAQINIMSAEYMVNYKELNNVWYFDYSRTKLTFNVKWARRWFSSNYTVSSELAITDISENERLIIDEDRFRARDIISSPVSDYTDENFWGEYNIIEPEQSIERIINRIVRQLRRQE